MDIDEILNGQAPEAETVAEEPATPETPEPEISAEAASQPRDESGRFAPKGEEQPADPVDPEAAPPAVKTEHDIPPAALVEERRKRQDAEARAAQLEQQWAQFQQQQQPAQHQDQQPLIPSVYEDENGFAYGLMQLAAARAQQDLLPQVELMLAEQRRDFQEQTARGKYPDWEEKARIFAEHFKANPALQEEARRHPNPAEYAYSYGKNVLEVQQIGSLDVDAIKAAAVQEYLSKQAGGSPQDIPTSLAGAQSARTSSAAQAPPSLRDILGR